MPRILLIIAFTLSSSLLIAQDNTLKKMFTAIGSINVIQAAAVKSEAIAAEHMIIIDGIMISNQAKLSGVLEGIYKFNSRLDSLGQ